MMALDTDLNRVSREHYITGKAAINFHWPGTTTGGWHRLAYWDSAAGKVKVGLAGIHYPDTSSYLGDVGIISARAALKRQGWPVDGEVYMANHFRAAADLVLAWALGQSEHCNVELADWFVEEQDLNAIVDLLTCALGKLDAAPQARVEHWLGAQLRNAK